MFFSQYFSFPLSVSFQQCSILIHSLIYHRRCIMFSYQYISFPLSVLFPHCSIIIHLPPTLYNVFLLVLQVSPVSTIPSLIHTHLYLNTDLIRRTSGDRLVNFGISVQHCPQQYRNTVSCFRRQQTGTLSLSLLIHCGGASPASLRCDCTLHVCPTGPLGLPLGSIIHRP